VSLLNTPPFDNNRNFIPRPFASNSDAVRNTTYYSPGAPQGVFPLVTIRRGISSCRREDNPDFRALRTAAVCAEACL
jgi:hypothetical protein